MDLVRYFLVCAEKLKLSNAAKELHISQPALTLAIQRLENELGTKLFLRSQRGLVLTEAGRLARMQFLLLERDWHALKNNLQSKNLEPRGRLRLGMHSSVATYVLPKLLPGLLQKYPGLEINLSHALSRHILNAVRSVDLDLGIVVNPTLHPDLIVQEIAKDEVGIFQADSSKKSVLFYDPSLQQSQTLLKQMQKKKIYFERTVESSSLEVITHCVASGAGMGILPSRVAALARVKLSLADFCGQTIQDKICLVYRPEFKNQPLVAATIKACKEAQI